MNVTEAIAHIMRKFDIQLTTLRKDILTVFIRKNRPLTAYQLLEFLLKKRANAKPPTVYRVLEYLINRGVVHRLDSCSAYTLCQIGKHDRNEIELIVVCQRCQKIYEFTDPVLAALLKKIARENSILILNESVEIKGQCKKCLTI